MKRTLAFATLFVIASSALAAEPPGSVREVEALERQLVEAIGRKDLATYDRIVADDYDVVVDASGKDITKAEVMASYRDGTRSYTGLEIFNVRTHVFGDTAVVSARTKRMRRGEGRDVPNDNRYVRVYARRSGRWRAVTQMSAPARPAP
ncbi:MAG: nuclear transport factor 2 family protein [Acidobacteriota bacterium]|nr:nuclear transport factor 2 family protein [Acidobacteriota bacterium]